MQVQAAELDDVRLLLARELGRKSADDIRLVRVNAGGQSNVLFRAQALGIPPLAVKFCLDGSRLKRDGAAARRQFDQLSRLHRAAEGRQFRVVEPICICEQRGIIVTAWAEGPSFRSAMLSPHASVGQWTRDCEWAGAWLRGLHSVQPGNDKALDTSAVLEKLGTMCSARSRFTSSHLVARSLAALERTAPIVEGASIPQRLIHGDFHPGNLIRQFDGLTGLDIEHSRVDHYLLDFVTWSNYIDYMTLLPRGLRIRQHVPRLNAAFISGYWGDYIQRDKEVFAWLCTAAMTSFYERYRRTGRTLFHNLYFRMVAGHTLRLLSRKLEGG